MSETCNGSNRAGDARPTLFFRLTALLFLSLSAAGLPAENLFELYQRARDFDPVFQAARLELEVAGLGAKEAKSGVRPSVSASADASKVFQNIRESDNFLFTEGSNDFFNQAFSISLTQPLYRADAFERVPQARAAVRQANAVLEAARQDLIFRLAEAHFELLTARDNVEFAVAERLAIGRQLAETEERLSAGLVTMTDLHDARGRYAIAEAAELQFEVALEEARHSLAEIVGVLPTAVSKLNDAFRFVPPDRPDVEAWVEAAMFGNPVIRAREAASEIAAREIKRQRGARRPTVDLVTSYSDTDSGGTEFGGGNEIATSNIALRVAVPLYDGGRASALTDSATLRHRITLQELEREKGRIERETRAAFQRVMSAETIVDALSKSVFSYEAALTQKTEGLQAGLNTGLEVLDARRDVFRAKRERTEVVYRYILDSLRLKRSAGILGITDLQQIDAYLQ